MEAKKILKQYFFSLVVIICISAFFLGAVRVREKTQYNMDMTPYETVAFEKQQDGYSIYYADKEYRIRTDYADKIRNAFTEGFIFDFRQIFG